MNGLTSGLKTNEVEIDKNSKTVVFTLDVDPKTRRGTHKNMFISVYIPYAGKTLAQNLYTGGQIRIDPPLQNKPKVTQKKDSKKPERKLSRLEQLRLEKQQRSAQK